MALFGTRWNAATTVVVPWDHGASLLIHHCTHYQTLVHGVLRLIHHAYHSIPCNQ